MPNRPNIRMVFSAIDLKWNVAAIAARIAADHKDTQDEPIVLLIVLNGAFMFGADLARALHARKVSYVIEFLSCASYKRRKSSGMVQIFQMPKTNLSGRRIVIVEDIVDTGITLKTIIQTLRSSSSDTVKSIRVAALLDKYEARTAGRRMR